MAGPSEYGAAVASEEDALSASLGDGMSSAHVIAVHRLAAEGMAREWARSQQEVIARWEFKAKGEQHIGPTLWLYDWRERADLELRPYQPSEAELRAKSIEYAQTVPAVLRKLNVKTHTSGNCDVQYFVEETSAVAALAEEIKAAIQAWMSTQVNEPSFYKMSAEAGTATVLEQRQDLVLALRAAQDLGVKVTPFPIEVPLWQEFIAIGISFVPYLGNAIALAEANEGRDMFCRKLDMTERAFMVALMAIPAVLRIAKAGKAIYTGERLAKLYGRDAAKWSRMIAMGERATADPDVYRAVQKAGARVKANQALDAGLVKEAEVGLGILTGKTPLTSVPQATRRELIQALRALASSRASLSELDHLALQRVIDAAQTANGLDVSLAKGQLLEELKESRTVRLLNEKFANKVLGLEGSGKLEYFPGHMLTDWKRSKLTDGIVGARLPKSKILQQWYGQRTPQEIERIRGVIQPFAVDEAKAGRASSKGLAYSYKPSQADADALKAVAVRRFQKLQARAAKENRTVGVTLEQVETQVSKEYKLGEIGGQARSTLERLDQFEDGSLPTVFFGDEEFLILVPNVSKVKIFGVLPKNVPGAGLTRRLRAEGINFESFGLNITDAELQSLTEEILKAAKSK